MISMNVLQETRLDNDDVEVVDFPVAAPGPTCPSGQPEAMEEEEATPQPEESEEVIEVEGGTHEGGTHTESFGTQTEESDASAAAPRESAASAEDVWKARSLVFTIGATFPWILWGPFHTAAKHAASTQARIMREEQEEEREEEGAGERRMWRIKEGRGGRRMRRRRRRRRE